MNPHTHAVHADHGALTQSEPETVHRWVVFGTDTIYLSHLSMFSMPEHAIQVIVAAEFVDSDGSPSTAYPDDRRAHPNQRLYTLDPVPFVLSDVLPADSRPPRRTTLNADLYRNHLEQQSTDPHLIAAGIDVRIARVVHTHRYDPDATPLGQLTYVLFGAGSETYLAHFITRPPDFDQIIRVQVDHGLSADQLAGGVRLTVDSRANTLDDRIKEGAGAVAGTLHTVSGDSPVTVTPDIEFYCNSDQDMTTPPRRH